MRKRRRRADAIAATRGKAASDPSIVVHGAAHAKIALSVAAELGVPVILESPAGAGRYLGAKVFNQMLDEAARDYPRARYSAVLDCGDSAGTAMNALRNGVGAIRIDARDDVLARLADRANDRRPVDGLDATQLLFEVLEAPAGHRNLVHGRPIAHKFDSVAADDQSPAD